MLFMNNSGGISSFHRAKLPLERFRQNRDTVFETRGVGWVTYYGIHSVLVHARCDMRLCPACFGVYNSEPLY